MNKSIKVYAGFIIVVAVVLAISSYWGDSPTIDEPAHIGSGYGSLVKYNLRLSPEHPPLAKDLVAFPLLFLNLNQDVFRSQTYWLGSIRPESQWAFGYILLYKLGNDADKLVRTARSSVLLLFVASAIFIFWWSYRLYGRAGSLISLIFFAFSPTVLAHSRLATTDMAALAGAMFAIYFFTNYIRKPTKRNLIISGVALGMALLTKFSLLLLIPLFVFVTVAVGLLQTEKLKSVLHLLKSTFLIFVIGFVLIVWPVYFFHNIGYAPEKQHQDTRIILGSSEDSLLKDAIIWLSDKPVLRAPGHYMLGVSMIANRFALERNIYFLGELDSSRRYSYFPVVYSIKEPLPWLIFILIALVFAAWQARIGQAFKIKLLIPRMSVWIRSHFCEFVSILWIFIFLIVSIRSSVNVGIRHLLPIYPFVILLVSGQITGIFNYLQKISTKLFKTFLMIVILLLGWYVFENFRIYPNYLTYFNQLAGGPSNGYKYVVDSNLDWGQDLIRLNKWLDQNDVSRVEFDYFGWADVPHYLGEKSVGKPDKYESAQDFIKNNKSNGWIAISATKLFQIRPQKYTWLHSYEPVAKVGNTIWVWHIIQ